VRQPCAGNFARTAHVIESVHHWLALAFTAVNATRALFYVPQIFAVARSVDGARDIALCTWWMWAVNNALGALYTGIALGDVAMAMSFVASVAGCAATIGLTMWKRHSYRRPFDDTVAEKPVHHPPVPRRCQGRAP
jgi:hypothetical protein